MGWGLELIDEYFQEFGVGEVEELVELLRLCWLELVELGAGGEFLQQEVDLPHAAAAAKAQAVDLWWRCCYWHALTAVVLCSNCSSSVKKSALSRARRRKNQALLRSSSWHLTASFSVMTMVLSR